MTDLNRTRAMAMQTDWRNAIDLANQPGGTYEFQRQLMAAEVASLGGVDHLARLISLGNAALVVADSGIEGVTGPWYRDMARRLLQRATEALATFEASSACRVQSV